MLKKKLVFTFLVAVVTSGVVIKTISKRCFAHNK